MSKKILPYQRFVGGIADYTREGIADSYAFGRSVDYRTDPQAVTLLPRTLKESGTTVIDLPKWGEPVPDGSLYIYGDGGNFYKRSTAASYSLLRTVANSHGNGLGYFGEDGYIYYTLDKVIGRYGPVAAASPQFVDDYFGSQGGVPLNTNSLDLEASSSQYADRADTASLSITGNLSIDVQVKPESLPTVGNTMTLVSKWNESGATRSYKFDIATVSGYFGDGSDGALTISGDTTEAPIDSACTGTITTTSLSATNASFASQQVILTHQTQGTNAGTWQRNTISGYSAGTITTVDALNASYTTGAQVRVMKQYTSVTVNSGITYTAKAWNGTVGGILAFITNSTTTLTGSITAKGKGFRAGSSNEGTNVYGVQGEGTVGVGGASENANGNGAGTGFSGTGGAGGGGGGNGTAGSNGTATGSGSAAGAGGISAGTTDLTTMVFGGGGSGGAGQPGTDQDVPESGGGIIFLTAMDLTISGSINSDGNSPSHNPGAQIGAGAGAGGSILLKAQTATLGTSLISAVGGIGTSGSGGNGGSGGSGRVHLDYYTSYTGSTSPTLDALQDNSLVTNTTYQLRLAISANGTALETLTRPVPTLTTGAWQELGVSWVASTSTATFYLNAVSLGTATGALTSINDNASRFAVGAYFNGASAASGFYDGLIDEVRLFNMVRSSSQFFAGLSDQILTTTAGLAAYYKFNGTATDSTASANNLTLQNAPVYSVDVPFSAPTTRLDIDQSATTAGNTYTVPVAISEASTDRKTFTPAKDPQKGVAVLIAAKGTGNWTVTVHDSNNNVLATSTVTNANLATGYYEFTYASVWRPLTNFTNTYHFHLTSTVADGTVTTTTNADLETVSFRTYYQFLVNDTAWHPVARMLQFLVFGNERWVGKLEASLYTPNLIALPAGWRIRCFGYWREYLAIGVMRGTNIYDNDMGRVYFWDGIAPTYNFYIDVPEGGINALYGTKGLLYVYAGYQGDMLVYKGGDSASKVKRIPKITADKYVEVYPGAVSMYKSLLRFGVAGGSDSTDIQKGAYTWGSLNERYPESLSYDYPISTGTLTGTTLKIGMTAVVDQKLLIGWQDNVSYGVDYVSAANDVFPTGTIEFLSFDNDLQVKEKEANTFSTVFNPLTTGQTVVPKYAINNGSWTTQTTPQVVGDIYARIQVPDGRYNEVQVAVDLATTSSTSPTLLGAGFKFDQLETEDQI